MISSEWQQIQKNLRNIFHLKTVSNPLIELIHISKRFTALASIHSKRNLIKCWDDHVTFPFSRVITQLMFQYPLQESRCKTVWIMTGPYCKLFVCNAISSTLTTIVVIRVSNFAGHTGIGARHQHGHQSNGRQPHANAQQRMQSTAADATTIRGRWWHAVEWKLFASPRIRLRRGPGLGWAVRRKTMF